MKKQSSPKFGVTSMGEKGQVVIPADIRSFLKLAKGEKFIVMAHDGGIVLTPEGRFAEIAKQIAAVEKVARGSK